MIGLRIFGIEADRLIEIAERLIEMAFGAQQIGATEIGRAMIGIGLDRPVEIGERGVVVIGLALGERAVRIGGEMVRIELDRLREIGDRLLVAAAAGIGRAARIVGCRIARILLHDFAERGDIGTIRAGTDFDLGDLRPRRHADAPEAVAAGRRKAGRKDQGEREGAPEKPVSGTKFSGLSRSCAHESNLPARLGPGHNLDG